MLVFIIDLIFLGVVVVFGYLLGLIFFGMVLVKFMGLGNLCDIGLGNIGVINVLCIGLKIVVVFILLLDGGKGVVVVFVV